MKTIEEAARDFLGLNESNPNYTHTIKDEFELSIFKAGVEFAQRWINVEKKLPEIDESGESDLILMKIDLLQDVSVNSRKKNKADLGR